jgi:hypothetical protein
MLASARTCSRPRGRGSFTLGNFKKDATVRPNHGRPRGHRPSVRPSENVRVTTLSGRISITHHVGGAGGTSRLREIACDSLSLALSLTTKRNEIQCGMSG